MGRDAGPRGASDWARDALVAMRDRSIAPTPENYLVWYTVAADANPTLSRVIQVLDTQSAPYDDERNQELFGRFFGDQTERGVLEALGERIEQRLVDLARLLEQIVVGTQSYDDKLDDAGERLASPLSATDFQGLLSTLRADTQSLRDSAADWTNHTTAHAAEMQQLRADLAAARAEAETDALTGSGNRKRFDRRLRELAALACEQGSSLTLFFADIDHFKSFNDTYGHALGDRVLSLVAGKLREVAGPSVEVFRYGGEEFAALATGLELVSAVEIAETIRRSVAGARISRRSGGEPLRRITLSVGLSQYEPGEPLARFLDRSDAALYAAKNAGRNRTSIKRAKNRAA
ncbi:MAG: GGDEF domain-containing protein [Geminicoccaceae bacterium]|nr:MAG: GGDEF domain-containing protein [Geminicoccaceae bacterium]